jgi:hypothetical protein
MLTRPLLKNGGDQRRLAKRNSCGGRRGVAIVVEKKSKEDLFVS